MCICSYRLSSTALLFDNVYIYSPTNIHGFVLNLKHVKNFPMCTYSMQVYTNTVCANNYKTTNTRLSNFKNNMMSKVMKKGRQKNNQHKEERMTKHNQNMNFSISKLYNNLQLH